MMTMNIMMMMMMKIAAPAQAPGAAPHPRASVAAPGPSAAPCRLGPAAGHKSAAKTAGRTAAAKTCRSRSGLTAGWKTAVAERCRRRLSMHATCLARLRPQRSGGRGARAAVSYACACLMVYRWVCLRVPVCVHARPHTYWRCIKALRTHSSASAMRIDRIDVGDNSQLVFGGDGSCSWSCSSLLFYP